MFGTWLLIPHRLLQVGFLLYLLALLPGPSDASAQVLGPVAAPGDSLTAPIGAAGDSSLDPVGDLGTAVGTFVTDAAHIYTFPRHMDRRDWLVFGGALAATGLAYIYDQELLEMARRNEDSDLLRPLWEAR